MFTEDRRLTGELESCGFVERFLPNSESVENLVSLFENSLAFYAPRKTVVYCIIFQKLTANLRNGYKPSVGVGHIPPHPLGQQTDSRGSTASGLLHNWHWHVKWYVSRKEACLMALGSVVST